jgi:hypothetical protein
MMKILNAFSANMLTFPVAVEFAEVAVEEATVLARECESAVGHADTAAVFGAVLGVPVQANRATVALKSGDVALLGQYQGPRLPEGATTLPAGAKIVWLRVTVK